LNDFSSKARLRGIQANHSARLGDMLDGTDEAEDMRFPGSGLHKLKGDRKGFYSVKISGNWRVIFKIVNEHASVTPNMALRLSKAFGTTAKLWMNVQQTYYLWIAANESEGWQNVERIQFSAV